MSRNSRRTHSLVAKSGTSNYSPGGHIGEAAGHRQARLEHILLNEIQSLITDEATDPSLHGVRILAVHLSPDGGHARLAYVVVAALEREREVGHASRAGLTRATGFLRARLAQQLDLKKLPKLTFTFIGVSEEIGGTTCLE